MIFYKLVFDFKRGSDLIRLSDTVILNKIIAVTYRVFLSSYQLCFVC